MLIFVGMIHVAFVSHGFPEGGIARTTLDLIRYCRKAAPELRFTVFSDRNVLKKDLPRDLVFLTVISTRHPAREAVRMGVNILVQCSRMEKNLQAARKAGVRIIYAEHGEPLQERYAIIDRRKGGRRRLLFKRILWNLFLKKRYADGHRAQEMALQRTRAAYDSADAFVVLCESYKEELMAYGLDSERLHVIPNAEMPVEDPCLNKQQRILYCGRLTDYDKKPARLLRIWARAERELPDYWLDIVGDGPERKRLERLARKLDLRRCRFQGWRKNVSSWYRKADILCLTSQTEAWSLSLTEAQANAVIPIAFACSEGVKEVLSPDGVNGFLVTPGDEDAFARTLVKVARMEEDEKRAIRENLLRKAATYDIAVSGSRWIALFRELCPNSAAKPSEEADENL